MSRTSIESSSSRLNCFRSITTTKTKQFSTVSSEDSGKSSEVMTVKREKRGLLRRGCGRVVRALFRCIIPCCPVNRRRHSQRDTAEEGYVAAYPVMAIRPRDGECRASIGSYAVARGPTLLSMTTLTTGRVQTATTGMIVARAAICRYLAEDGLLNRPQISAWSQRTTRVTIERAGSVLTSAILALNFWSGSTFGPRLRLADVPYNSPAGPTINGRFGRRLLLAIIAVREHIQDQTPIVHNNYSCLGPTTTSKQQGHIIQCRPIEEDDCISLSTKATDLIMGRMRPDAVTFQTTAMAVEIVARFVVNRGVVVDELLTRPWVAAWSQWMATVATVSISRVDSTLANITWARNFWTNPAAFKPESQLANVPFVPRWRPCNLSFYLLTVRGHFGNRPTQDTVAAEIQEIQHQPRENTSIVRANGFRIPRHAFTGLNTVNWLITVCRRMGWAEPTYSYACNEIHTAGRIRDQHVVECCLVTPEGRAFESIVMDTDKKSAKRRAALIILGWVATVVGDAPTQRWGALYGSDVCDTNVITTEI